MGFVEGTGDEFLLTCIVCKNPFGLVAQFCGYCQATRQQALGVERARTSQQIIVTESQPIAESSQANKAQTTSQPKPPKIKKQKIFLQNLKLRIDRFVDWQNRFSRAVGAFAFASFLLFSYVIVQTYLFVNTSPIPSSESYLYPGISKQETYFHLDQKKISDSKLRIFPERYLKWDGFTADRWSSRANWNGWSGKAEITFTPAGNFENNRPVYMHLEAKYSPYWKVFRKIDWVLTGAAAQLELDYPRSSNLSIYINGLAAGSTANPAIPAGTYLMYPGPIEIKFYDLTSGELQDEYTREFFISTSGKFKTNYRN